MHRHRHWLSDSTGRVPVCVHKVPASEYRRHRTEFCLQMRLPVQAARFSAGGEKTSDWSSPVPGCGLA